MKAIAAEVKFKEMEFSKSHLQNRVGLLSNIFQVFHGATNGGGSLGGTLRDECSSRTGKSSDDNSLHCFTLHQKMKKLEEFVGHVDARCLF